MNVAIIGAGFTGLAAGYRLSKYGHNVTILEKDHLPGGLAVGIKQKEWQWTLEKHYHHWFTSDQSALNLANEIKYNVCIHRPKTCVYVDNEIFQLDSPLSVLQFPKLTQLQRLRMAVILGFLRYNPAWQLLEHIKTSTFLPKAMGEKPYSLLWEPLLRSKFGSYMHDISLAWFWARIRKRTANLAYPEGGFLKFAQTLCSEIESKGGKIFFNTEVREIKSNGINTFLHFSNDSNHRSKGGSLKLDKVIVTLPSFIFLKIAPQLPDWYRSILMNLKGLGAINIILRLKKPFLEDGTYWLNICEKNAPLMAIVEHTNFIDKQYYNNEHLVYLGNYLPITHKYFSMEKDELLTTYDPILKKINPSYKNSLIGCEKFAAPFAQPIIPTHYSKIIPSLETPLKNIYLANMQQIYPWDRGTNYAIELGKKVATLINNC